jgi:hypothetical protein
MPRGHQKGQHCRWREFLDRSRSWGGDPPHVHAQISLLGTHLVHQEQESARALRSGHVLPLPPPSHKPPGDVAALPANKNKNTGALVRTDKNCSSKAVTGLMHTMAVSLFWMLVPPPAWAPLIQFRLTCFSFSCSTRQCKRMVQKVRWFRKRTAFPCCGLSCGLI